MSDISINLDGLIAFLVAALLGSGLGLAIVVCSVYGWLSARKRAIHFHSQPIFAHIVGMLLSTAGCVIIMLLVFLRDGPRYEHDLERWLDQWVILWAIALLGLWPITVWALKKLQSKPQTDKSNNPLC
jgi:hypothetical protein